MKSLEEVFITEARKKESEHNLILFNAVVESKDFTDDIELTISASEIVIDALKNTKLKEIKLNQDTIQAGSFDISTNTDELQSSYSVLSNGDILIDTSNGSTFIGNIKDGSSLIFKKLKRFGFV